MSADNSAAARAAALRAHARRGLWRPLLSFLGVTVHTRRADAQAAQWARGAVGEKATARLLDQLPAQGWAVRHDMRLLHRRFNVDHVVVSPCGTAVGVIDSKVWRRNWSTALVDGRVHCDREDRHEEVEKVAKYAQLIADALAVPGVTVWPVVVVHGSPVAGGRLEVRKPGMARVLVLDPEWLLPTLSAAPRARDPQRAAALTARVDQVLRPYVDRR